MIGPPPVAGLPRHQWLPAPRIPCLPYRPGVIRGRKDENDVRVLVSEMMKVTCRLTVTPLNVCRREPAEPVTASERI
jgi:hypothetical protein